ncbi:hypothetical protein BH10ACI2_BH10ACI2_21050 [soil metagenome]
MRVVVDDRVQDTSTTTGTGSLTLSGTAPSGYVAFDTAFGHPNDSNILFSYKIALGAEWETGLGYLSAATTLVRFAVKKSSNANAAVSFSAGTKVVSCDWISFLADRRPLRVLSITSSGTPTANTDNYDFIEITAQAADIASMSTNLTGTPIKGETKQFAITGTAARSVVWSSKFEGPIPDSTIGTTRLDVFFVWNDVTSKWKWVADSRPRDRLAPNGTTEISITGATTATLAAWHVCSGTSADYTVNLPALTVTAGKYVAFRMSQLLTKLVTLDAGAGMNIDGKSTTLSAAISSSGATSITITSATGFPAAGDFIIQIDSELLKVTAGHGTTTWTVTRGFNGTTAATHSNSVAVDWNRTRIMWANEVAELEGNGTNWTRVGGKSIPMSVKASRSSSDQSVSATTLTNIGVDTQDTSFVGPAAMWDSGNSRIKTVRSAPYLVYVTFASIEGGSLAEAYLYITKNGTFPPAQDRRSAQAAGILASLTQILQLGVGDYVQAGLYANAACTVTGASFPLIISMVEQPTW